MLEIDVMIAVVDDDAGVCQWLTRLLAGHGYQVRAFQRVEDYLAARDALAPACVLADVRMPELDGLAVHRDAGAHGAPVPTVFMTGSGDVSTVVAAMKAGASDVLEKPCDAGALLRAVRTAVDQSRAMRVVHEGVAALWQAMAALTPREAEVCALVATGRLNKQVAAAIGTTEKTVKVHRARALQKLHVHSVAELVRLLDHALQVEHLGIRGPDDQLLERPHALDIIARTLSAAAPQSPFADWGGGGGRATLRQEPALAARG